MKTPERFNKAIKALVTAFFQGTLTAGNCRHCAVGNICGGDEWSDLFLSNGRGNKGYNHIDRYKAIRHRDTVIDSAFKSIEKTGYAPEDLATVESAFEMNCEGNSINSQFRGLMAVVEVLCEIEGINADETKKLFEYTPEFKPVHELA